VIVFSGIDDKLAAQEETKIKYLMWERKGEGTGLQGEC
jgi:hypothetical protein